MVALGNAFKIDLSMTIFSQHDVILLNDICRKFFSNHATRDDVSILK